MKRKGILSTVTTGTIKLSSLTPEIGKFDSTVCFRDLAKLNLLMVVRF